MFGKTKLKQQIAELEERLAQAHAGFDAERAQWDEQRAAYEQALAEEKQRTGFHVGLFRNEVAFSQTLAESQKSMVVLSQAMKREAEDADKALATTSENKSSLDVVVANVHDMARRTKAVAATVETLNDQASRIGGIVNLIKEVADQTNLLALNAAIEAARAGEQGRGFAVVADEVRKLSERTSASTSEIASMIARIQSGTHEAVASMTEGEAQASQGVALATRAGEAIGQIRDGAQRVTGVVTAISDAIRQQSAASNEISTRVERIAQMTEEGAEESSRTLDAARELQEMSQILHSSVSRFSLG